MQFTSFEFGIFLTIIIITYFLTPIAKRWLLLLVGSYFFYGFHNPAYVFLLGLSTMIDFIAGLRIYESKSKSRKKKWLRLSILMNLGLLFFFKYYNFFVTEINQFFVYSSIPIEIVEHSYLLPIGISFYTFQSLSYSIDVYRGYLKPETHLGKFALFICFFPQLIAGPIERAKDLLGQFHFNYQFDYNRVVQGMQLILWGIFKKIILADWLALYVNEVYDISQGHSGPVVLIGTLFFFLQVYFDFSGYCDIAIGMARILGIRLSKNFGNYIYFISPKEFWKGWHMTISNWYRDYVFFPLTKVNKSKNFTLFSLFLTFIISGIWHGAGWGFIIWGCIHGLFVVFDYAYQGKNKVVPTSTKKSNRILPKISYAIISFVLMILPSIFFRANSVGDGVHLMLRAFNWSDLYLNIGIGNFTQLIILTLIVLATIFHIGLKKQQIYEYLETKKSWTRWSFYLILIHFILYVRPPYSEAFIYFEF